MDSSDANSSTTMPTTVTVDSVAAPHESRVPGTNPGQTTPLLPGDTKAIDGCRRISEFLAVASQLYYQSVERQTVNRLWVDQTVARLADLTPVISPAGGAAVQSVLRIIEPKLASLVDVEPEVSVPRLQSLITEIAPTITVLMTELRSTCPTAVPIHTIDDAQHVDLKHLGSL